MAQINHRARPFHWLERTGCNHIDRLSRLRHAHFSDANLSRRNRPDRRLAVTDFVVDFGNRSHGGHRCKWLLQNYLTQP